MVLFAPSCGANYKVGTLAVNECPVTYRFGTFTSGLFGGESVWSGYPPRARAVTNGTARDWHRIC